MSIYIEDDEVAVENINHVDDIYVYFGRNTLIWNKKCGPIVYIWRHGSQFKLSTEDFNIDKLRIFMRDA